MIATLLPNDAKRKEIKAFFSTVGKIEKIQMVFCRKTHQFLKKAYVYFGNVESVLLVSSSYLWISFTIVLVQYSKSLHIVVLHSADSGLVQFILKEPKKFCIVRETLQ